MKKNYRKVQKIVKSDISRTLWTFPLTICDQHWWRFSNESWHKRTIF